jgi:hypothetical protein
MESVPKIVRQRLQITARQGEHPDANLLTAFAEKSLTQRERMQVLDHLAGCVPCREIVSLAQSEYEMQPVATLPVRPRTLWLSGRILQWGTLAAFVAVAGTAILVRHQRMQSSELATYGETSKKPVSNLDRQDVSSNTGVKKLDDAQISRSQPAPSAPKIFAHLEPKRQEKQRLTARELDSSRAFAWSANTGSIVADEPVLAEKPIAPPPPSPSLVFQKSSDQEELKKEAIGDKVQAQSAAPSAVNENVVVAEQATTSPAGVEAQAQPTTQPQAGFRAGAISTMGKLTANNNKDSSDSDNKNDTLRSKIAFPKARWQISADGKIMRSQDLGESWQPVQVADNVVFRALCVIEGEVWVGGSQGHLFYSSDAGSHWEQIKPSADGQTLTSDVWQIQFYDSQHGTVTTTNHQTWVTSDGGHGWHKQ